MTKSEMELDPDFPLGALAALFVCRRRIFGHFCYSSLSIAGY